MAENDSTTENQKISDVEQVLRKIHALGAALANQDWDAPLAGQDLQYFGFLIEDLVFDASKKLYSGRGSKVPQAAAPGGE